MERLVLFVVAIGFCFVSFFRAGTKTDASSYPLKPITTCQSEIKSLQKIKVRFAAAPPYTNLKEVEIKSALIQRVDQRTRLGGYTVVLVTLTNIDGYTCDTTDKPTLQTADDFAVQISLVELFDKKGPEKTLIHLMLYDNKIVDTAFSKSTSDVEFKKFNISLHQLNATKDKVYLKTDVTKGTCKFVRSPEGTRLVVKYNDKNFSVDGDVDLTFCKIISPEQPKQ